MPSFWLTQYLFFFHCASLPLSLFSSKSWFSSSGICRSCHQFLGSRPLFLLHTWVPCVLHSGTSGNVRYWFTGKYLNRHPTHRSKGSDNSIPEQHFVHLCLIHNKYHHSSRLKPLGFAYTGQLRIFIVTISGKIKLLS